MALWRSWLARRPVTAEVAGSSPVRVAHGGEKKTQIFSPFSHCQVGACYFPYETRLRWGSVGRKPGHNPQRESSFYSACYQRICLCFAPLCIVINRAHTCITALWRSWLARRPVTAEVAGSSPVRVAGWFPAKWRGSSVGRASA